MADCDEASFCSLDGGRQPEALVGWRDCGPFSLDDEKPGVIRLGLSNNFLELLRA
jgi:hypothetical protein